MSADKTTVALTLSVELRIGGMGLTIPSGVITFIAKQHTCGNDSRVNTGQTVGLESTDILED